jgi:hypothetical protein
LHHVITSQQQAFVARCVSTSAIPSGYINQEGLGGDFSSQAGVLTAILLDTVHRVS